MKVFFNPSLKVSNDRNTFDHTLIVRRAFYS